jgi:ADYC domain-containing protein
MFIEGTGLERLHFSAVDPSARGVFPPAPGTQLASAAACGGTQPGELITVNACAPVPKQGLPHFPLAQGVFSCDVDVTNPGICGATGPKGGGNHHRGMTVVRGYWDERGAWHDDAGIVTLSCDANHTPRNAAQVEPSDGAITKCARKWGIDPADYPDAFLACIRMARADYCGDGQPHTLNGTFVHLATPHSPMRSSDCADGQCFEASWSKNGAVCISHPRWSGADMGYEACQNKFVLVGGRLCRGAPEEGVISSRSQKNVCGQAQPASCGPDADPVCTSTSPTPVDHL